MKGKEVSQHLPLAMPIRLPSCSSAPSDFTSFLPRRGKCLEIMDICVDEVWLPWEPTSVRQHGHKQFFLRICCTGMARAGTPHALRRMGEMCCKVCSPHGNQQILHRQQLENETLSCRSITEIYLMRSKRKVNRIILILNLCLPLCKNKVRSPSLPSSSTITHNRVAEWLLLTASPWCQNCARTSHFSC